SVAVLSVVISAGRAEVLLDPKQVAKTSAELADILKNLVTTPAFLESLEDLVGLIQQPVDGFLRIAPRTMSRDDVMLVVPPDVQREIASRVDQEVSLRVRVSDFIGAGKFDAEAPYRTFESAGYCVALTKKVAPEDDGALRVIGRVSLSVAR